MFLYLTSYELMVLLFSLFIGINLHYVSIRFVQDIIFHLYFDRWYEINKIIRIIILCIYVIVSLAIFVGGSLFIHMFYREKNFVLLNIKLGSMAFYLGLLVILSLVYLRRRKFKLSNKQIKEVIEENLLIDTEPDILDETSNIESIDNRSSIYTDAYFRVAFYGYFIANSLIGIVNHGEHYYSSGADFTFYKETMLLYAGSIIFDLLILILLYELLLIKLKVRRILRIIIMFIAQIITVFIAGTVYIMLLNLVV